MSQMSKPRIIAFYLPQYHPTPNNDLWWGKGFTEWTNVGKARPLFPGHYQPHVPGELGYYDLRLPIVREQQAQLAREAGIEGFCYYHYWFENGKEELDLPFKEVVESGKPDFPFCLCWANQSWENKMWNKDGAVVGSKLLVEQKYLGKEDNEAHFYSLLKAFKDPRYIKIDNRPLFMIYQPLIFDHLVEFMSQWNDLAQKHGMEKFFFVGQCGTKEELQKNLELGFDLVNYSRLLNIPQQSFWGKIWRKIHNAPRVVKYSQMIRRFNDSIYNDEKICPVIIPGWDHTPRSGNRGLVYSHSTPELFRWHVNDILETTKNKKNNVIFLKSWNEWGEGNYIEPDLKYGRAFLNVLKDVLSEFKRLDL